jgi:hypothetical protein
MNSFNPDDYGPVFAPLVAGDRRRALDAGHPDIQMQSALNELTADSAFSHCRVQDHAAAECCLAAIWLLHDFLGESHSISQQIDTPEGSYWHAIMHRREGDFTNSKYWYRRVGQHPVFKSLSELHKLDWDPYSFVDECQAAVRGKLNAREMCLDLQQSEWELLFDYCYRRATGD